MAETILPPPVARDPAADSFFTRALNIFISPGRAFESIVCRPDFLVPLAIAIAGYLALVEAELAKIGEQRILQKSLELSGKAARMTPVQLDQYIHRGAILRAIGIHWIAVFAVPIYLLVVAAAGLFIVNVLFGQSVNFEVSFSVICYASLVRQVAFLLGLAMIFLASPDQFNPQSFIPVTVGFFLDPRKTPKPLYVLASSFDIVRIWFIALCSLGLSVATGRKVVTSKIFFISFGAWTIVALGHAGLVALRG
jgi:hypothetical protein